MQGHKIDTLPPCPPGYQMLELSNTDFKIVVINMFKKMDGEM